MSDQLRKIKLIFTIFLLTLCPATSFAWVDYGSYWNYHGSGRDHPYSYYIDNYYTGYVGYPLYDFDESAYLNYINSGAPPPLVPVPPATIEQVPALPPSEEPDEFTVNIPNSHGGYTAVIIKKSGNGYVGPQGEYYPEFPKVSQLKLMYG